MILACNDQTDEISTNLELSLWFYQNGIMRAFLEEPNSGRFRVSDTELPVVEKQLQIVPALSTHITKNSTHVKIANLPHNDNSEIFSYFI